MAVVVAMLLLVAAAATGTWVLRVVNAAPPRPFDGLLAATAIGNGILGIIGLALAGLQALHPGWVWLSVGALAVPGLRGLVETVVGSWRGRACIETRNRVAAVVVGAYLLAAFAMVLAPSVTGDQTKYQLAYPKLFAHAGGLVPTPWTFWGQQQFLENFAFALCFSVGDEVTAHVLHAAIGLVALAAAGRLVELTLAPGWGWVTVALLATQPMTWSMLGANGSDLPVLACTLLSVTALVAPEQAKGGIRRAACLAGVAAGSKVMGLLTLALIGGWAVLAALRRGAGAAMRTGVIVALSAAPFMVAPYARNVVDVGNPIHPFGHGVFQGANWTNEGAAYLGEYYRQYRVDRAKRRGGAPYDGVDVVRFPWDLTLYPESFERSARWALDVGPFMLAALPAAGWLAWRSGGTPMVIAGIGAAYVMIIAVGAWAHPRYVLPGIVLLSCVGLAGLRDLIGRRLLVAVVGVTVAGQLVVTTRLAAGSWVDQLAVATGRMERTTFLDRHSDRHRFWRAAAQRFPRDATILVLGKIPHPYFIEQPFVLGSYLEQTIIDYRSMTRPEEVGAAARRFGATGIVFETEDLERRADPYESHVTALWRGFRATLGRPLVREGGRELYRLPVEVGG